MRGVEFGLRLRLSPPWLLLAVSLASGCSIDRSPDISSLSRSSATEASRHGTGAIQPATPSSSSPGSLNPVEQNDARNQRTVGGVTCVGVVCPFTEFPTVPCCTSEADLAAGAARIVDRCGIDLSATGQAGVGDFCWQRDQPGVIDAMCPSETSILGVEEVGCCTEQGRCGTLNSGHGLGCHYNGGAERECGIDAIEQEVTCDGTGAYAIRVDVDVTWGGRTGGLVELTDDGRGPISITLLAEVDGLDEGMRMSGSVRVCDVELPPFFSTTLCESYVPIFPERIWDSDKLPEIPLVGLFQCLNPGCLVTFEPQTVLLGIELENPEAPWPTSAETGDLACSLGQGEDCFPDHDDDGYPGLTVELVTSGGGPPTFPCPPYTEEGPPLSENILAILGGVRRSDRIFLGTRAKVGATGRIGEDCSTGMGVGVGEFVQSRAWGCLVQPGTTDLVLPPAGPEDPCLASEAQFLDDNLPIYYILGAGEAPPLSLELDDREASTGPVAQVLRIAAAGEGASCADAREAVR